MNYLAHLLLAGTEPRQRLGSLIADFTRGRLETLAQHYPEQIVSGIAQHRQIDRFTDQHADVIRSKRRFSPARRRYAGIIVDILHDHFLSRHWQRYSEIPRNSFITDAYQLLSDNHHKLPERMQRTMTLMIQQDWLGSYLHITGIAIVYDRLSRRLHHNNGLAGAIVEVQAHYNELERDFENFFPDLFAHAKHIIGTTNSPAMMKILH